MATEKQRAYYLANRARILARVKARAATKREEIRAYKQAWHAAHRVTPMATEKQRAYYQANRARILAQVKARAAAKREEIRIYKQAWHAANRPRIIAEKRADYAVNKATVLAQMKAAYAKNPAPAKARSKAYQLANPEKKQAMDRAWRQANAARVTAMKAEWRKADYQRHPEKYKEIQGRRKAQKQQSQVEKVDLKQILRDAKGLCGICHKPFDLFGIDFDHIVPLSKGGAHTTANIQATHSRCNQMKGTRVI